MHQNRSGEHLLGEVSKGTMVFRGEKITYKYSRTNGSKISHYDIYYSRTEKNVDTPPNGQHGGLVVLTKDGKLSY